MQLSIIQNHIISQLKNADFLRYRDMKSTDLPNDLYNYHLKMLIAKQLVTKSGDGYSLSPEGHKYVADIYPMTPQANHLFKINVIVIVSRIHNDEIEILNQTRHSQPSYGQVGVMGGVVLKGEPTPTAAKRKLSEETGLSANFRLVGIERRQLYKSGELFSDIVFPICYADITEGVLIEHTEFGDNYWVPLGRAIENDSRPYDSIQAIPKVLRALQNNKLEKLPFFYDETVQKD